jgi:membrane protease YdiL (CAAX protease family)
VRSDLLALPDVLVAATLAILLCLLVAYLWSVPHSAPTSTGPPAREISGMDVIYGTLQFALPVAAILAMLIGRNVNPFEVFGLGRVGVFRGMAMAGGLILVLLPILAAVTEIASKLLGEHAEQQAIAKVYQQAARTGNSSVIWKVIIAAVCIAPVTEEIVFRGYIYPVFKRVIGATPAALGSSLLFAGIHNNALGFPGLALLALALTLAYEFTGSLLVSIFMHAWFNGMTLFAMWWAVRHGFVT